MLELKKRDVVPSGGWQYFQDGVVKPIVGGDLGHLILGVLKYRVEHGLAVDNVAAEVEDQICRRSGAKCRPPAPMPDGTIRRKITVADAWRFLNVMTAWAKEGTFVPQEEAERRAEICAGCRFNIDTHSGCWGCASLFSMVSKVIGKRKTRLDHALRHCGICGCVGAVQVFVPLPVLLQSSGDLEYPSDTSGHGDTPCWKRATP